MGKIFTLFLYLLASRFTVANAHTYYVSASGDDTQAGTSKATAWKTVNRVNSISLQPGDKVLFEAGSTFEGSIWLRGNSQGTPERPIVIGSYGHGTATINSGLSYGLYGYNMAGIELRNLRFTGSGRLSNVKSGVIFYLDSANTTLQHILLDSLEVSGYRSCGITIGSWNGQSGYDDVRIINSQVHDNGEAGISTYAEQLNAHHNWYVGNCKAYNNSGRAEITNTHTGNGIVLSGIDGALIEKCEAFNNGWLNANPNGGPVGIWGWCCNNLIIQDCESHHNHSGTAHDGGGFDLDGGCTNSILQYNYSHDNDGPGYLIAQYPDAPPLHDVTIRYNISTNDARRYNQGAIMLWSSGASGGIQRAAIYNNTVYLSAPTDGSAPKAVYVSSGDIGGTTLRNNLLQTEAGLTLVESATNYGVRLEGNCYWSSDAKFALRWNGETFASLDAWRTATTQEMLGNRVCGLNTNPQLAVSASSATAPAGGISLTAFRLPATSALVGAGLNLMSEFGQQPGSRDFYKNATPAQGVRGNIGADESVWVVQAAKSQTAYVPTWCTAYPTLTHDQVHVVVTGTQPAATTLHLYDLQGRLCRTQILPRTTSAEHNLVVSGLPAGRYVLHVIRGEQQTSQPVIVTQ